MTFLCLNIRLLALHCSSESTSAENMSQYMATGTLCTEWENMDEAAAAEFSNFTQISTE